MITSILASFSLTLFLQSPGAAEKPASAPAVVEEKKAPKLPGEWGDSVRYHVAMNINNKQWEVMMGVSLTGPQFTKPKPFEFWLPRWTPGGYHLADFAKFVEDISAEDADGKSLKITEVEEPRHWTIDPGNSTRVVIRYKLDHSSPGGFDPNALDMEANRITKRYAFINSTSLFGFVPELLEKPAEFDLDFPENWKVATPLTKNKNGAYTAPNYYRLEDSPLLASPKLIIEEWKVDGIPHALACYGKSESDVKMMAAQCEQIATAAKRLMGSLPYDHYIFLLSFANDSIGGGGLEHTFSTLILLPGMVPASASEVKHVLAHEYFHLWNAERIHVDKLQKPDYTKPLNTGTIWLNEGATEYMSFLLLTQAEVETRKRFFAEMSQKNAGVHSGPEGRKSIVESSRAWSSGPMSNLMEIVLNVYERGAVTTFAMDLMIRAKTDGKLGMADVFKYLMEHYVNKDKGYGEDELPEIIKKAVGVDMKSFYDRFIAGSELPDLDEYLKPIGLKMNRGANGLPARGGFHELEDVTDAQKALRDKFFELPGEK